MSPFSPWTPSGHEDTQYGPSCKCTHASQSSAPCRTNEVERWFNKSNNPCKKRVTFYRTIDYRSFAGMFVVLHRTLLVTRHTFSFRSCKLSFFTVERSEVISSENPFSHSTKSYIIYNTHTSKRHFGCVSIHSLVHCPGSRPFLSTISKLNVPSRDIFVNVDFSICS